MITFQKAGLVFFVALLISVLATPLSVKVAEWVGAIDHPDEHRKHHGCAVPRLGGIGIALGFLLPLIFLLPFGSQMEGLLLGACVIAVGGLLDDALQLRAIFKLVFQIAAAACFVFISGASLTNFGNLFGFGVIEIGALAPWMTIFCIVGVINAMNLCDGMDGLAAGFSAIACIFLSVLVVDQQNWVTLALLLALMGGILGFLRYNTHPARLFMGDIGSMVLGYGLAAISVLMVQPALQGGQAGVAPISIALILALPIMDTLVVMVRRVLHGKSPFAADRTHLHHRLLALGLQHDQTVMLLYSCMALFGCLALAVEALPEWLQLASGLAALGIVYFCVFLFGRYYGAQRSKQNLLRTISTYTSCRMCWLHDNIMAVAMTVLALLAFAAIVAPVPNVTLTITLYAVLAAVLLLYPWHPDREHAAVQKGVVYLMVAALFLAVHLYAPEWLLNYLAVLALLALVAVVVRAASWSAETHGSSSFQLLILLGVAIIPLAMIPLMGINQTYRTVTAFLEAVPVAWLLNGYSVPVYRRNRRVTLMLFGLLVFVVFRAEMKNEILYHLFF